MKDFVFGRETGGEQLIRAVKLVPGRLRQCPVALLGCRNMSPLGWEICSDILLSPLEWEIGGRTKFSNRIR